jgi:hypothetical protein
MRQENFQQARALKCDDYMNGHRALQATLNPEIMESLDIPALDDALSIQVALTNLIRAILYDHVSEKKAGLALYGLQLAAMNLGRVQLAVADGESATDDPKPIIPFWSGEGYRKHLAQRGMAMMKDAEIAEKRPDKIEAAIEKRELAEALASAAG